MERRLKNRHNIPAKAIVSFSDATSHEYKTLNISGDGAFLVTDQPKPVGTRVFISLFMDIRPEKMKLARKPIKIDGFVNRRSTDGMAICFDHRMPFAWM